MKIVRVGNIVYEDTKRIAEYTHGGWYKYRTKAHGIELEPCDSNESNRYASMVDALKAPISDGELAVLGIAEGIVREGKFWKQQAELIMAEVRTGISYGIARHGPYHPDTDERDMMERVMRSARNVVVYASMQLAKSGCKNEHELRSIARDAAALMTRIKVIS